MAQGIVSGTILFYSRLPCHPPEGRQIGTFSRTSIGRDLTLFFSVAFAFSWVFWIPQALASQGFFEIPDAIQPLFAEYSPAAFGPSIAAFSLVYLQNGGKGVKSLLKRAVDARFGKAWFLPIFLLFPAIVGGGYFLSIGLGESLPELSWLADPAFIIFAFIFIFLLGGPLQEEFGWRGYALSRLQAKYNATISSLVLGLLWGAWHLPLFWIPGETIYYERPIWGFMVSVVLVTFLFTWLFNNTRGSLLAALLFHTTFNLSHALFPVIDSDLGSLIFILISLAIVVLVMAVWGPRRLARGWKPSGALDAGKPPRAES